METTNKIRPKNKTSDRTENKAEPKKLSQFGKAMLKYRGWGEIVDMKAVLK